MVDPRPGDEGKWVHYTAHDGHVENGRISSWNDHVVFVRYHSGDTAAATDRKQLDWGYDSSATNL